MNDDSLGYKVSDPKKRTQTERTNIGGSLQRLTPRGGEQILKEITAGMQKGQEKRKLTKVGKR